MVLEKTLESPLDCKEIQPVHPKGNQFNIHWKDWWWRWSSSNLATWYKRADLLEKTLMLGKIESRRRGWQRMRWLDVITNSQSLLKLMPIRSVMPSNHLILCYPLLLLSIFPSIRVFSNESVLCMRWPKYWEFQLQHQSFQWIFRVDFL